MIGIPRIGATLPILALVVAEPVWLDGHQGGALALINALRSQAEARVPGPPEKLVKDQAAVRRPLGRRTSA